MSAVALRCSACGSTQAEAGECAACRQAQVAYFCSNHSPGRWLDGPVCSVCGSRFGETTVPAPQDSARTVPASAAILRRLEMHELLLRALLTHLAMSDPETFGGIVGGLVRSDDVPDDVARELTSLVEEVAASLRA